MSGIKRITLFLLFIFIILTEMKSGICGQNFPELLSGFAKQAVEASPRWLRNDLADALWRLGKDQDRYALFILENVDQPYFDELAFTVAHTMVAQLRTKDFEQVLLLNAQQLYQIDEELNYVDIIDIGDIDSGDYYSTTKYYYKQNGDLNFTILPRDIYYWYVVHPRLTDETPSISSQSSPINSTFGYFWREYLFYNPSEEFDYTRMYILHYPNTIEEGEIEQWHPSTYGFFINYDHNDPPDIAISEELSGQPVLMYGPWSAGGPGCFIMTMMPVERMYENGYTKLLENLILMGNGNIPLLGAKNEVSSKSITANLKDEGNGDDEQPKAVKVAIFKDRDPWGKKTIENYLSSLSGLTYDVYSSTDFGRPSINLASYAKVIIPSDQPYSFYSALSQNRGWFEDYMNRGRCFEFHGATREEDDWAGLIMPTGISCVPQAFHQSDLLTLHRYPTLKEFLTKCDYVWDNQSRVVPSGRDKSADTVDMIGLWVSIMLPFRARTNRPIQPNQIAFEHNGNCGEIQDLLLAALRTALIPARGINHYTWDHVWNEFFERGWRALQVDWNGNVTRINQPGNGQDRDFGGGKDVDGVWAHRGDDFWENVTINYTPFAIVDATVLDKDHQPVDNAEIRMMVYGNNDPRAGIFPYPAVVGYTNSQGKCSIPIGNQRAFFIEVEPPLNALGKHNYNPSVPDIPISTADTIYPMVFHLPGPESVPQLKATPIATPDWTEFDYQLCINFKAKNEVIYGGKDRKDRFSEKLVPGNIDFCFLTEAHFNRFMNEVSFGCFNPKFNASYGFAYCRFPQEENLIALISNAGSASASQMLKVNFSLFLNASGKWIKVAEDSIDDFLIPAGGSLWIDANSLKPVKPIPFRPLIPLGGYMNTRIDNSGGSLILTGFVPEIICENLEILYQGVPTGLVLVDNGTQGDWVAGDHLYTFSIPEVGAGIPSARLLLELEIPDLVGLSYRWPYCIVY